MANTKLRGAKIAASKLEIPVEEYLQNVNSGLKWCVCCKRFVCRDLFYDMTKRSDGKQSVCKDCARTAAHHRYHTNPFKKGRK